MLHHIIFPRVLPSYLPDLRLEFYQELFLDQTDDYLRISGRRIFQAASRRHVWHSYSHVEKCEAFCELYDSLWRRSPSYRNPSSLYCPLIGHCSRACVLVWYCFHRVHVSCGVLSCFHRKRCWFDANLFYPDIIILYLYGYLCNYPLIDHIISKVQNVHHEIIVYRLCCFKPMQINQSCINSGSCSHW